MKDAKRRRRKGGQGGRTRRRRKGRHINQENCFEGQHGTVKRFVQIKLLSKQMGKTKKTKKTKKKKNMNVGDLVKHAREKEKGSICGRCAFTVQR